MRRIPVRRVVLLLASFCVLAGSSRALAGSPANASGTMQVSVEVVRSCKVSSAGATASVNCGAHAGSADLQIARRQPAPRVNAPAPDASASTTDHVVTIEF